VVQVRHVKSGAQLISESQQKVKKAHGIRTAGDSDDNPARPEGKVAVADEAEEAGFKRSLWHLSLRHALNSRGQNSKLKTTTPGSNLSRGRTGPVNEAGPMPGTP
jgi:hypothetical protein